MNLPTVINAVADIGKLATPPVVTVEFRTFAGKDRFRRLIGIIIRTAIDHSVIDPS